MEIDQRTDVEVGNPITVGKAERLFVFHIACDAAQSATGHGFVTGVDQGHAPWLAVVLVHVHAVGAHVEGDVRGMQEVVGEEILDRIAL